MTKSTFDSANLSISSKQEFLENRRANKPRGVDWRSGSDLLRKWFGLQVGTRNAVTRDEWVKRALNELPAGSCILDAGAGNQRYRTLCSHLQYVALDFGRYDPNTDRTGLQSESWSYEGLDIVSDVASIPMKDGSFDAILCTEVLEHIANPLDALDEFSRLLRPGGQLIVTAPFCSLTHQAPFHFTTGFSRYFYEKHLPRFGFMIQELQTNGNYYEYLAQELGRLPEVALRYSHRRAWFWKGLIMPLLIFLQQCSRDDSGSSELLSFGYHVRAVKELPRADK